MTLYAIYARPESGPDALAVIGDRFVWSAFLFTPIWALVKGAWGFFVLWLGIAMALWFAGPLVGSGAGALYFLFALWSGFAAPAIAARVLSRRAWIEKGELVAANSDTALRIWLARTYGSAP